MSRSPLAYPLTRGIDGDSGGSADLQTDVMRFMAILGLLLVAIFALVQSLPMEARPGIEAAPLPQPQLASRPEAKRAAIPEPRPAATTELVSESVAEHEVELTRPESVPMVPEPKPSADGFTLRFESDLALTRLVATGQVGFYAIDAGRAQRMMVSDSRVSFWDASTPNTFHEMEASTVPHAVVAALSRSGVNADGVKWGVTLPGKLHSQLNTLMQKHTGGALVIRADGSMQLEAG